MHFDGKVLLFLFFDITHSTSSVRQFLRALRFRADIGNSNSNYEVRMIAPEQAFFRVSEFILISTDREKQGGFQCEWKVVDQRQNKFVQISESDSIYFFLC